jgi:ABC-type bacteriocin/lantibiotic exporter with double-glycine peptidase domain
VRHLATLGVTPPRDKGDRLQVRRFLRALVARWLVINIVLWSLLVLMFDASGLFAIVAIVLIALNALDVLWLSYQVRRDERRLASG